MFGHSSGGSAVAFTVNGLLPADVGYILRHEYDIIVRTGYHCAPLLAERIGAPQGTVRVNPSYFTKDSDIDQLLEAVSSLTLGISQAE